MGKVNGVDGLIRKLRTMNSQVQKQTKEVVFDVAQSIASDASRAAPPSFNVNARQINSGYSAIIFVGGGGNLAAYREFGTGISAATYVPTLPQEWQDIARSFYINGKGTMVKRPFLYPAYRKNIPDLKSGLIDVLKKAVK
jgi:HK97 gp10 family phage protein